MATNQKIITFLILTGILSLSFIVLSQKPNSQNSLDQFPEPGVLGDNTSPSPTLIINNSKDTTMDVSDLKIEDSLVGTGKEVKTGDTVVIHYKGTLLDGTKFDSSYDRGQPFETRIGVGDVIEGWDKGVVGMKVGGKRTLTIPSSMAYGPNGIPGVIPPKSALVFQVELVDVK